MNRETVSVVIPYYRASQTIARAVESALGQTIPPHQAVPDKASCTPTCDSTHIPSRVVDNVQIASAIYTVLGLFRTIARAAILCLCK